MGGGIRARSRENREEDKQKEGERRAGGSDRRDTDLEPAASTRSRTKRTASSLQRGGTSWLGGGAAGGRGSGKISPIEKAMFSMLPPICKAFWIIRNSSNSSQF